MNETIKRILPIIGIVLFAAVTPFICASWMNSIDEERYKKLDERSAQYNGQFSSYYLRELSITVLVDNVNEVEYIKTSNGIIKREVNK